MNASPTSTPPSRSLPPLGALLNQVVKLQMQQVDLLTPVLDTMGRAGHPLVLDANVLRAEIGDLARRPDGTALVSLARIGFLHLYAAPHVIREVDGYLDKWAAEMDIGIERYRAAWFDGLLPLITTVELSGTLLTPDETKRIGLLARSEQLGGDPDDVPTAIAAMVLGAPLLSDDGKPLLALYGPGLDRDQHRQYL